MNPWWDNRTRPKGITRTCPWCGARPGQLCTIRGATTRNPPVVRDSHPARHDDHRP